jgi:proteasome lid subunit RPN8/RPN11
VRIVRRVLDDIRAHAAADAPRECCGVLIGSATSVVHSVRARNLADSNTRFELDPRDHIDAIRYSRARQLDVVGFYHSHPRSRPYPSETDVAESGYAGVLHLIVGLSETGALEPRLFTIDGTTVTEVMIESVEGEEEGCGG